MRSPPAMKSTMANTAPPAVRRVSMVRRRTATVGSVRAMGTSLLYVVAVVVGSVRLRFVRHEQRTKEAPSAGRCERSSSVGPESSMPGSSTRVLDAGACRHANTHKYRYCSGVAASDALDPNLRAELEELTASVCRALNDPKRSLLLYAVAQEPRSVGELGELLGAS